MALRIDSQLLTNLKQIIEVSQARGCWRAPEMSVIGTTYNTLCNILKELGELQNTENTENTENTQEQQVPETGENTGNSSNTENVVDGTGSKVLNI